MAQRVLDRVHDLHRAGLLPRPEANDVVGEEDLPLILLGVRLQVRQHGHLEVAGGPVVRQHAHRSDVSGPDDELVVGEHGRRLCVRGGHGNDLDPAGRRLASVGDGVGEGFGGVQPGRRADPRMFVVVRRDDELGPRLSLDGLEREDAAAGIRVVAQHVDEALASGGQHRNVVLGDRRRVGVALDSFDADDPHRRRRPVRDEVRLVVGARLGRGDCHGALIRGGLGGQALGARAEAHELERVAVGVRVVGQRVHRGRFAGHDAHEVAVGPGRLIDAVGHFDDDGAVCVRLSVRDDEVDVAHARPLAEVGDGDGAGLPERGVQPFRSGGALEVDLVAVGIDPIPEHLEGRRAAGGELCARIDPLHGRGVLTERVDGDVHRRGRLAAAPVVGLVREGRRSGRPFGHVDLQSLPVAPRPNRAEGRLAERFDRQDVPVLVVVVEGHGQRR